MSFLSPLFLIGAAAAAVPIVLHLLKREPEVRVRFAAVKLLRHAPVEHSRKRYLRELLLLALRVAALVLLAVAFARPFIASGVGDKASGITVIGLDTSLSLSAPRQFDRAQQLAREAVARAPRGDLLAVLTFADAADVKVQPTADRSIATAAIDAAAPGFGGTSYRSAFAAAAGLVQAHGGASNTIVIVTDLQESGWDSGDPAGIPASARVEVADVGVPPPNFAVTAARASSDRVVATIRNAAAQARETRIELTVDGKLAGEATASIGPNQSAEVTLAGARGGSAIVSIADREGIQADNVRYLVLDNAARPAILVVTGSGDVGREAFYVQHALRAAGPGGASYQVVGVGAGQLSAWDQPRLSTHRAVLLLSTKGLERRGRELLTEYVQKGGGMLVAAGVNVDGQVAADLLGGVISPADPATAAEAADAATRTLAPADARHPVFQPFASGAAALGLVKFRRVAAIRPGSCSTLARFTRGGAALLECAPGSGRALVLASDLDNDWNDFPLHPTFVPFLHSTVLYLVGGGRQAGEYLVAEAPSGVPPTPGIARLPGSSELGSQRTVAVNVDPAESDPSRLTVEQFQTAVTYLKDAGQSEQRLEARQEEERQHIWQYVLALMLTMLVLESFVGARTV